MTNGELPPDENTSLSPKLRRELEMALAGDLETSLTLQQALDDPVYNQGAVERVWRSIADGSANIAERDVWLTAVAKRVVTNVLDQTEKSRPQEALKALHLYGQQDRNWRLAYDLDVLDSFEDLDDPTRKLSRREVARRMQARGHLSDKPVGFVMKVIDRLRDARAEAGEEDAPPAD